MKIKFLILIVIIPFIFNSKIFSQEKITKPYDISEYFLLIPEHFLKIDGKSRQELLKKKTIQEIFEDGDEYFLDTIDFRNVYMKFQTAGDGEGMIFEITYYILSNNDRIIAVNFIGWSMCCEDSFVRFFQIKNNKWVDITSSVLPEIKLADFYFDHKYAKSGKSKLYLRYYLPQKGKDIKVKLADTFFEYMNEEDYLRLKDAKRLHEIKLRWNNGNFLINK